MKIKVDFITPPFSGHLYPLIELAKPLLAKDFDIRFITGPNKLPLLKKLGFKAIPILPQTPNAMENIANTPKPVRSNPKELLKQLKKNLSIVPQVKAEIKDYLVQNKTDIVVADFVATPAGIACDELGIPWITAIVTPFAIETNHGTPSYLGGWMYAQNHFSKIRDFLGRRFVRFFKNSVGRLCKRELDAIGFSVYRPDGTERVYSPYSILGLGMKEFEFPRDWPKCFKFIGPTCESPEDDIKLNLSFGEYRKTVLVTIGTHLEWSKMTLVEEVRHLANNFKDVLFVVSYGRPQSIKTEPVYHQGNVIAFEYLPYGQYLKLFDVVVHHGGAGIVYSCIKNRKPSIAIPHDYDHFDFAARMEYFKVGFHSKRINSVRTVKKLHELLSGKDNESLAEMQKNVCRYNPQQELENEIHRLAQR